MYFDYHPSIQFMYAFHVKKDTHENINKTLNNNENNGK